MIPSNLKAGDTFVDGKYTFRVNAVYPNGFYSSERITPETVNKEEKSVANTDKIEVSEITSTDVNYSKTQVNRMPNAQLEKLCKELGLEVGTGTEMKRAIIAKLGL
jgi:DNA-binding Xre family transcriptional regulator